MVGRSGYYGCRARAGARRLPSRAMDASRIVSAGGSVTEIIYALGAESRLVAVDTTSNFPNSAADLLRRLCSGALERGHVVHPPDLNIGRR